MQHASTTREIAADPSALWEVLADVTAVTRYHPAVKTADLLSERPTGLGAARRCNFHDGSSVREEVIAVDEGRRVRLALSAFSVPMKQLEAEWRLVPTPDGGTEVTFEIAYVVKYGLLGRLLGATVIRRQLTQVTARVVAGLDHLARTGQPVGEDFVAA